MLNTKTYGNNEKYLLGTLEGCIAWGEGPPTPLTGPPKPVGAVVPTGGTEIPRPEGIPLPGPRAA